MSRGVKRTNAIYFDSCHPDSEAGAAEVHSNMYNASRPMQQQDNPGANRGAKTARKPIPDAVSYRRHEPDNQPAYLYAPYRATTPRAPAKPLIFLPHTLSEVTGPIFGHSEIGASDNDLTRQHEGEPLGERIIVSGRVLDDQGRAVP